MITEAQITAVMEETGMQYMQARYHLQGLEFIREQEEKRRRDFLRYPVANNQFSTEKEQHSEQHHLP